METKTYIDRIIDFAWVYGPKALIAIAFFIIGWWVIRRLTQGFDHFLKARHVDPGLRPFFTSLSDTGLKVILIFMVANTIGIETTSFIAIFSAIAFSVGLALQGSLGNFASGVLILLFKPFKVGDTLTVVGLTGKVSEIQIFSTILRTSAGKKIIIPNAKMTQEPIQNIEEGGEVQTELNLLVSNNTSLETLRKIVSDVAKRNSNVTSDREPEVKIKGMSRDDMKVEVCLWTHGEHYDDTSAFLYEELKKAFTEAGIELAKERRRESF